LIELGVDVEAARKSAAAVRWSEDQPLRAAEAQDAPEPTREPEPPWQQSPYGGRRFWERLSEHGRRAVYAAAEYATSLGERYVDTEHLLLGLFSLEDSVAHRILKAMNVDADLVSSDLRSRMERGRHPGVEVPTLAPRGRKALDWAFEEARQLNDSHLGTEHLLLGLLHMDYCRAGVVLHERGASLAEVRKAIEIIRAS
jgi:ATP-dependent Clp protease ATP-binding subunit ClpC